MQVGAVIYSRKLFHGRGTPVWYRHAFRHIPARPPISPSLVAQDFVRADGLCLAVAERSIKVQASIFVAVALTDPVVKKASYGCISA